MQSAYTDDRDPFGGMELAIQMFAEYVDWRAEHPSDDLMTKMLTLEFEDETGVRRRLTRDEILTYLTLIASAGNDTTNRLIGWTGKVLSDHPDQRQRLLDDPALIPNAIEEVLRFEPPPYHIARYVDVDADFHGSTVPAGSALVCLPGAANRDERRFPDPDTFDVGRKMGHILSFGYGPHHCLGAALARLEGRVVLEEILKRFPEWEVDDANARLTDGFLTRGYETLPVLV
jgi:cytochrome P450